jgi:hypothetical protein
MRKIWLAVPEAKAGAVTAVLVAGGNTSREVGAALFISPRTVEMHVRRSSRVPCWIASLALGGSYRRHMFD